MKSLIIRQNNRRTVTLYTFAWILWYNKLLYDKRRLQLISSQKRSLSVLHYCQWPPWSADPTSCTLIFEWAPPFPCEMGDRAACGTWYRTSTISNKLQMEVYLSPSSCSSHPSPSPSIHSCFFSFKTGHHKSSSDASLISQMMCWLTWSLQEGKLPTGWLHPAEITDALWQQEEENQSWSHYPFQYHHTPSSV